MKRKQWSCRSIDSLLCVFAFVFALFVCLFALCLCVIGRAKRIGLLPCALQVRSVWVWGAVRCRDPVCVDLLLVVFVVVCWLLLLSSSLSRWSLCRRSSGNGSCAIASRWLRRRKISFRPGKQRSDSFESVAVVGATVHFGTVYRDRGRTDGTMGFVGIGDGQTHGWVDRQRK